jgi:dTDP-4-dehydrorhamnose 3,5-epimerase-like enzyme
MENIQGKKFCDERGFLSFVNDLDLSKYKRFYLVQNHKQGFIRGWHGHLKESKAVICIQGSAKIGTMQLTKDEQGVYPLSATLEFTVLSATNPSALIIPAGYANGAMTLTSDCILMYLSDVTVEESHVDDYRFSIDRTVWEVKDR